MIVFTAHLRHASCRTDPCDRITTGSVGIPVRFAFSAEWEGLAKTAVFRGSGKAVDVLLTGDECCVPPEVLTQPGDVLSIGVYGTDGSGELAIPTVYADAGRIHRGAEPSGIEPTPETASLVEQLLAAAQAARAAAAAAEALAKSVRDDADDGVFAEQAADMVLVVSDTEPTVEPLPKIWIDDSSDSTIAIPTMEDIGDLDDLVTTAKDNLVAAINEAAQSGGGGGGTGDYDDLTNQPQINGNTLSGNKTAAQLGLAPAGAYVKPSGGIPKTDLAPEVQTSLGKADTALQSVPSTYRTAAAQDAIDDAQDAAIAVKYTKPSGGIPESDLAAGVIPTVPTKTSDLTNDSGFVNAAGAAAAAPVTSVNGQTGAVTVPEPFFVTYSTSDMTTWTCDKTFAQITAAMAAGKQIVIIGIAGGVPIIQECSLEYDPINDYITILIHTSISTLVRITHDSSNVVSVSSEELTAPVPRDQGVSHAGEFLVVGSDGFVTTVSVPSAQGVSF